MADGPGVSGVSARRLFQPFQIPKAAQVDAASEVTPMARARPPPPAPGPTLF